jgi:hypothetical protein
LNGRSRYAMQEISWPSQVEAEDNQKSFRQDTCQTGRVPILKCLCPLLTGAASSNVLEICWLDFKNFVIYEAKIQILI